MILRLKEIRISKGLNMRQTACTDWTRKERNYDKHR